MSVRLPNASLLKQCTRLESVSRRACTRPFTSTSMHSAVPKKATSKGALYARRKGLSTGEEDGNTSSQGSGNVLSEVILPPPDLSSIKVLQPESLNSDIVGQVRAFSPGALAAFKALTIPRLLEKEFAFTSKPASVVRKVTIQAKELIDKSRAGPSSKARHIFSGEAGCGKSMLLMQTMAYAQATGWVVLYLPSATPLVNSSTPHVYSSTQALFDQPALSAQLLSRFVAANKVVLKKIKTSRAWSFGDKEVKQGTGLDELATKNVEDKTATSILGALFEELSKQQSVPVLLAIDDSQALFATSSYVDPTYKALESFSLMVPRLLLEYVSGAKSFNKGSVLLAPSPLSPHQSPAMTRFLGDGKLTSASAYTPVGTCFDIYSETLQGVRKFELPARLEREEAVGVVKMLQAWRGVREGVSDQHFLERYVASGGSPRHFRKSLETSTAL